MPLYIDDQKVPLRDIIEGKSDLNPEIIKILHNGYDYLNKNFWKKGVPVILRYKPGIIKVNAKNGFKEGKKGIFIPWSEVMNTTSGSSNILFCHTVEHKAGGEKKYVPVGERFNRMKVFSQNEAELALFYFAISPLVAKGGKIIIENKEKEASDVAQKRMFESSISFYLYNPDSPLFDNREKLENIANAWGVPGVEKQSDDMLRNKLFDIVNIKAEVEELSAAEFIRLVKEDDPLHDVLAIINKAMGTKILQYKNFAWKIVANGNEQMVLPVPVADDKKYKVRLAHELLANPEKYGQIKSIADPNYDYKLPKPKAEAQLAQVTESFSDEKIRYTFDELIAMDWFKELRPLALKHGITIKGNVKADIIAAILAAQTQE